MKKNIGLLLAIMLLALNASFCLAAGGDNAGVEKALRERFAVLEKLWAKGDGAGVAREIYGRDAVIQGEGQKETIKTAAAVEDIVRHLVADSRSAKLDIAQIRVLAPDAALTWVTWHVVPKAAGEKPFEVKSLFVWTQGPEGWRIRADMYVMGSM